MATDHPPAAPAHEPVPCGCGAEPPATTPCCPTRCEDHPRERNLYYLGRFLAARDLRDEQAYQVDRHRLANRLFHGSGVICGLDVKKHPRPECAGWIVVHPGLALDACGREVFVCECKAVRLPPVPGVDEPCPPADKGQVEPEPKSRAWGPWLVCLRYTETPIEPGPVLLDDGSCASDETAYGRVREGYAVDIVPFDPERHQGCWLLPSGGVDTCPPCEDQPAELDCFGHAERCADCIALALLTLDADGHVVIDVSGRRRVPSTRSVTTRVCAISWPHGGRISVDQLRAAGGRLEVTFTRPLRTERLLPGTGIGPQTFEVTYSESQRGFEIMPAECDPAVEDGNPCRAVFTIERRLLEDRRRLLEGSLVRVRLLGDFILDCHGQPADVEFLGGLLPTGDGAAGGIFESWFWIGDVDESPGDA